MAKKKAKKAAKAAGSPKAQFSANQNKAPKDSGLYFWMYVIGGILMALGFLVMYFHHTIPGLVVLVLGAILLFYGNKYTKEKIPPNE